VVVDRFIVAVAVRGISTRGGGVVMGQHWVFREGEEDMCIVASTGGVRR
jgi:hypothetical protein